MWCSGGISYTRDDYTEEGSGGGFKAADDYTRAMSSLTMYPEVRRPARLTSPHVHSACRLWHLLAKSHLEHGVPQAPMCMQSKYQLDRDMTLVVHGCLFFRHAWRVYLLRFWAGCCKGCRIRHLMGL